MSFFYSLLTALLVSLHMVSDIPYTEIESAFMSNNSNEIVSFGKEKILLNILGNEGVYSQQQATLILKDFFNKKPISTFRFTFKGKETNEGSFAIGNYLSKTENYRITIQFKKSGNDYKIESLTIEKG